MGAPASAQTEAMDLSPDFKAVEPIVPKAVSQRR